MALRAIMLRSKIDKKKSELEALRQKDAEFATREAELEKVIEEASTDEEQAAVQEEVEKYETEKAAHDAAKSGLETEISGLEDELTEVEKDPPAEPVVRTEKKVERTRAMDFKAMNIRSLPKHMRAFDAIPYNDKMAMLQREDVKEFLTRVREMMKNKRAVSGADLMIPVVFLELISENMYRYSKLVNRVRVRNVRGEARQTIAGTVPEAVWTEMCGAINELSFNFNQIVADGYKVAGYVPVCNSLLEDTDIDLASWIIEMISESIGLAKDKAILYGKGASANMPLGIVTRLAQTQAPDGYPANAPAWEDLHKSNVVTINGTSLTGAQFWAELMEAVGNTYTTYSRGNLFWAMNSKTYAALRAKLITFTATGDIVANLYGTLPIITGDVDILEFIPDGDIIGGYGDLYLWVQRGAMSLDLSTEVQFIQDNTVFRGKERADGMPIIPGAFVAININNTSPTTVMDFAADTANDAQLTDLSVGSESLTFKPTTYSYTIAAAANASDKIEATPSQPGAQIAITYDGKNVRNGGTVTWLADSTAHPLTVQVKQGNAVRVYTVNVTKASA